jgi:hypothetical protein
MNSLLETTLGGGLISPALMISGIVVPVVFLLIRFVLETIQRERVWPQFPMISVRGETPKRSFSLHGRETVEKGLRQVFHSSTLFLASNRGLTLAVPVCRKAVPSHGWFRTSHHAAQHLR